MELMKQVHGHEVMAMMQQSGHTYSRESLIEAMDLQFGASTLYESCSAKRMNASELIDFLWSKGKLTGTDAAFRFGSEAVCDH
jgi:probable metal-binding protein